MIESNFESMEFNRVYSCVFRKTNEEYGGFSNMAGGYPLLVNGVPIRSSEALYQACRFPSSPEAQEIIINEASPMMAKRKASTYKKEHSRDNWEVLKVDIMFWCLKVKLIQNHWTFGKLLESTGNMYIVEDSHKDNFWGALKSKENPDMYFGKNVLGRLLMELRSFYWDHKQNIHSITIPPLDIPDFKLFGKDIEIVSRYVR
jgi:ribA/ribD-fused uncharacterized protein